MRIQDSITAVIIHIDLLFGYQYRSTTLPIAKNPLLHIMDRLPEAVYCPLTISSFHMLIAAFLLCFSPLDRQAITIHKFLRPAATVGFEVPPASLQLHRLLLEINLFDRIRLLSESSSVFFQLQTSYSLGSFPTTPSTIANGSGENPISHLMKIELPSMKRANHLVL